MYAPAILQTHITSRHATVHQSNPQTPQAISFPHSYPSANIQHQSQRPAHIAKHHRILNMQRHWSHRSSVSDLILDVVDTYHKHFSYSGSVCKRRGPGVSSFRAKKKNQVARKTWSMRTRNLRGGEKTWNGIRRVFGERLIEAKISIKNAKQPLGDIYTSILASTTPSLTSTPPKQASQTFQLNSVIPTRDYSFKQA